MRARNLFHTFAIFEKVENMMPKGNPKVVHFGPKTMGGTGPIDSGIFEAFDGFEKSMFDWIWGDLVGFGWIWAQIRVD